MAGKVGAWYGRLDWHVDGELLEHVEAPPWVSAMGQVSGFALAGLVSPLLRISSVGQQLVRVPASPHGGRRYADTRGDRYQSREGEG